MSLVDKLFEVMFFLSASSSHTPTCCTRSLCRLISSPGPRSRAWQPGNYPNVSMLIAAYNEESVIGARIRNFIEGRYPGWSELIIVSDGSTDRTAEVARSLSSDRVRVLVLPHNGGKAAALDLRSSMPAVIFCSFPMRPRFSILTLSVVSSSVLMIVKSGW